MKRGDLRQMTNGPLFGMNFSRRLLTEQAG
jgi:hypothetical protein